MIVELSRLTLYELLERASQAWGDRALLLGREGGEAVPYREVLARTNGLAWMLADLGLRSGDRVAVVLPSTPEMLYLWFALARLGAVMVPVNPGLVAPEIQSFLDH